MALDKLGKPLIKECTKVKLVDGNMVGATGLSGKVTGTIKVLATVDFPVASSLPEGTLMFDSTAGKLKIIVAGAWVDAA